ncbi:MAG: hypothetical protein OXM55_00080 [Bdellovibrionales bacterium]|nr:hypothetical protein [Bdellovibrionales bacterium]
MAAIDIGSNTSLLLIARISKEQASQVEILEDQLFFTRLAQREPPVDIPNRSRKTGRQAVTFPSRENGNLSLEEKQGSNRIGTKISLEALERQKNFFKRAKKLIHQYSVEKIKCVATAAARQAQNAQELLSMGKEHGFSIDIISAEEEALISRKGALFRLSVNPISAVVLDIGGASTEISTNHQCFSLPIGSVNLTEEFIYNDPPTKKEIQRLTEKIQAELRTIPFSCSKKSVLVAVAGTPTTLATLENKTDNSSPSGRTPSPLSRLFPLRDGFLNPEFSNTIRIHGKKLSINQVQHWWEHLFQIPVEKRKTLKGMPFYRADVMPAGLSILKQVMNQFQWKECLVSITGLRYGLLHQMQGV